MQSGEEGFQVQVGTYGELASWLPEGGLGLATNVNNIVFAKLPSHLLVPVTKGCGAPYSLAAGGLPTLPALAATGTEFSETPPAQSGDEVTITNTTGAAINVATGAGASINGAAIGTAYALAAGATKRFILDGTGTNWMVF